MATKALKEVNIGSDGKTNAGASTASLISFNVGDTAFLTWGSYTLPVVVQAIAVQGGIGPGGDNAIYTVVGDIRGSSNYLAQYGQPYGPFKVTANLLATR